MAKEDYTRDRLFQFLRQSTIEGILNPAVARSRINAVEQLFSELNEAESLDIRKIDVDILCTRIHKINDSSIRPEVLNLYNKRAKAALHDYFSWVDNPDSFFSIGGDSIRKDKRHKSSKKEMTVEQKALEDISLATSDASNEIISIPLREGRMVYVQNLPLDLTDREAQKIARVIVALADEEGHVSVGNDKLS
ncbi:MAG: hypothetical protein ACI92E_003304 [Oceanicoccus sp.]|jgi:hypothetical protein